MFRNHENGFFSKTRIVQRNDRIKTHFLVCILALLHYRLLGKQLGEKYTCNEILEKLREMNFVDLQQQGFIPTYTKDKLTDDLHDVCDFRTDYQFINKSKMKEIQKLSKGR